MIDQEIKKKLLDFQKSEITEYHIYNKLSYAEKNPKNKDVLRRIADDELRHHNAWREFTGQDVKPDNVKIWRYFLIARILGLTFGIKLMERTEKGAIEDYNELSKTIPAASHIVKDEIEHEKQLIDLIDEERLKYVGSMVLGLNDALVELTGALAGFTFALQKTNLIAMAGLITGIAASLSMAASEYLSTKSDESGQNPLKACLYTGVAYVGTVIFLIFPYLLFSNVYFCLSFTLLNALIVILIFTFYISVAKDLVFKKRFLEMAFISLGVAVISFAIGFLIRIFFNIEV